MNDSPQAIAVWVGEWGRLQHGLFLQSGMSYSDDIHAAHVSKDIVSSHYTKFYHGCQGRDSCYMLLQPSQHAVPYHNIEPLG